MYTRYIAYKAYGWYSINKFFALTFEGFLIYDHDIKIPRYQADGINPIFLTRPEGLDPITGDNHYFFDSNYDNPNNYNLFYVERDVNMDGYIVESEGDYSGYKVVKTGAILQFMEYWMLSFKFEF